MSVKVKVWADGVHVRKGVSHLSDPANSIGTINSDEYTAIKQCAGGQVDEDGYRNFWWVQLDTPVGRGWVSAVYISTGGNQQPIPTVSKAATVNT
jgi:hypothetical protein